MPDRQDVALALFYTPPIAAVLAFLGTLALALVAIIVEKAPADAGALGVVPLLFQHVSPRALLPLLFVASPLVAFALALLAHRHDEESEPA